MYIPPFSIPKTGSKVVKCKADYRLYKTSTFATPCTLRFPRIDQREDKNWTDCTTYSEVEKHYNTQHETGDLVQRWTEGLSQYLKERQRNKTSAGRWKSCVSIRLSVCSQNSNVCHAMCLCEKQEGPRCNKCNWWFWTRTSTITSSYWFPKLVKRHECR